MEKDPCLDCKKRHLYCHVDCKDHKKAKKKKDNKRKKEYEERMIDKTLENNKVAKDSYGLKSKMQRRLRAETDLERRDIYH